MADDDHRRAAGMGLVLAVYGLCEAAEHRLEDCRRRLRLLRTDTPSEGDPERPAWERRAHDALDEVERLRADLHRLDGLFSKLMCLPPDERAAAALAILKSNG